MSTTPNITAWDISGDDAIMFFHGQTCNDVANLAVGQWQLNAYLSIKGRVVALFWATRNDDDSLCVLTNAEIAESVFARLKMFVMRSKVVIQPSKADAQLLYQNAFIQLLGSDEISDLRLIEAGLASPAWIDSNNSDKFLPQMLNLDLTNGLSFKKGCYPGQEIVARTAHRGRLKQRLMRYETEALIGEAITLDSGDSAGVVVASSNGQALAVTRIEHADASLSNAKRLDLPYSLD